jgi:hypothetical protein
MLTKTLADLGAVLPILAGTEPAALACALDRTADLMLAYGRAAYAEHLARRAAELREAAQ